MRAPWAIITVPTVWPLMSMPRNASAAAGLHLRLDDGDTARLRPDLLGGRAGLLGGGGDGAGQHGHPVLLEHVAGLVLEEIHGWGPSSSSIRVVVDRVAAASRGTRARARTGPAPWRNRIRLSLGL